MDQTFLIFVIVLLPIISACVGFTVHFAIRPMADALIDALHGIATLSGKAPDYDRITRLEAEVATLRHEVQRLESAGGEHLALPEAEVSKEP